MKLCDCTIGKVVYISETETKPIPREDEYYNPDNYSTIKFELIGHIIGFDIDNYL